MVWVFVILGILGLIGAISAASEQSKENQKKAEFNEAAKVRVAAYAEFMKRTSQDPKVSEMSEIELQDMLHTKVREYKKRTDGANTLGAVIVGAGVLLGIVNGMAEKSWIAFFVTAGIGIAFAVFSVGKQIEKIDQSFAAEGFDVARLKVSDD